MLAFPKEPHINYGVWGCFRTVIPTLQLCAHDLVGAQVLTATKANKAAANRTTKRALRRKRLGRRQQA